MKKFYKVKSGCSYSHPDHTNITIFSFSLKPTERTGLCLKNWPLKSNFNVLSLVHPAAMLLPNE